MRKICTGWIFVSIAVFCFMAAQANDSTTSVQNPNPKYKDMLYVPQGKFMMGLKIDSMKYPRHEVNLSPYYIDKYLVSVEEYREYLKFMGGYMPAQPKWSTPKHPIVNVTWKEADAFCRWKDKRLPTEAEWEKAAYIGSVDMSNGPRNPVPFPVRKGKGDKNGMHDMNKSLWQWTNDWYDKDYYKNSPYINPTGPNNGEGKVLRGGSYSTHIRNAYLPDDTSEDYGFRCAISEDDYISVAKIKSPEPLYIKENRDWDFFIPRKFPANRAKIFVDTAAWHSAFIDRGEPVGGTIVSNPILDKGEEAGCELIFKNSAGEVTKTITKKNNGPLSYFCQTSPNKQYAIYFQDCETECFADYSYYNAAGGVLISKKFRKAKRIDYPSLEDIPQEYCDEVSLRWGIPEIISQNGNLITLHQYKYLTCSIENEEPNLDEYDELHLTINRYGQEIMRTNFMCDAAMISTNERYLYVDGVFVDMKTGDAIEVPVSIGKLTSYNWGDITRNSSVYEVTNDGELYYMVDNTTHDLDMNIIRKMFKKILIASFR